jgi:hypothetical protein
MYKYAITSLALCVAVASSASPGLAQTDTDQFVVSITIDQDCFVNVDNLFFGAVTDLTPAISGATTGTVTCTAIAPVSVSFDDLHGQLRSQRLDVVLSLEDGERSEWMSLMLSHADGLEIASTERNVVVEGQMGSEELAEFADEVSRCKPETSARWLLSFLQEVRVIYAFQHLSGAEKSRGDDALWIVTDAIRAGRETIMQADGEGEGDGRVGGLGARGADQGQFGDEPGQRTQSREGQRGGQKGERQQGFATGQATEAVQAVGAVGGHHRAGAE